MRARLLILPAFFFSLIASAAQPPAPKVVDLKAPDGINLKATYFAAAKPGPGILLLHQCNQQRKSWDKLATSLASAGINVLTLDYRGFGESGGTPTAQLPPAEAQRIGQEKWPGDVDTAFNFLISQPGVKKDVIGAGGASCGVNQSIQLARRHPEVKSLVLLSGGTDREGRYFLKTNRKLPLFISAADDDGGVVEIMQWLMAISGNPGNDFLRYPAGGHGVDMFAPHPELPGKIVSWFQTTLIKTPGTAPASASAADLAKNKPAVALLDQPDGPVAGARMLKEAREKDPKATPFQEAIVNQLAYERLQSGDMDGGIAFAKLNVDAFPESANAYDSLSDAYLADGQRDLAKQNAEKALTLLEKDSTTDPQRRELIKQSAEQKLKDLSAAKP
jgi:dienelactone hydrolase